MDNSQIKPKVFLSHSKLDEKFVKRIYSNLLKCQCSPWLDTEEIRDGKSWLDVIFAEGIPACDVLIVYLTQNSIDSKMVQRELNAAFVEQLRNNSIQVLPYVSEACLRSKLRPDIASLQCREWNSKNFATIFPSIVAEIWRSNFEKKLKDSVLREKGIRLDLEHKLNALETASEKQIFSIAENSEFDYLFNIFNRSLDFPATLIYENGTTEPGIIRVDVISCLYEIVEDGGVTFSTMYVLHDIRTLVNKELKPPQIKSVSFDGRQKIFELQKLVLKYGLVDSHLSPNQGPGDFVYQISQKYRRFVYWLEFNKKKNMAPVSLIKKEESPQQ